MNWKEVTVWAAVTMIVTVAVLGGSVAFSGLGPARAAKPTAVIDDVKITASGAPIGSDQIEVTIDASNPTARAKKVVVPVSLVASEFTGNPMSRVSRPDDYSVTTLSTKNPTINVPAGGSNTLTLQFEATKPPAPTTEMLSGKTKSPANARVELSGRADKRPAMPRQISYSVQIQGQSGPYKVFVPMKSVVQK